MLKEFVEIFLIIEVMFKEVFDVFGYDLWDLV